MKALARFAFGAIVLLWVVRYLYAPLPEGARAHRGDPAR